MSQKRIEVTIDNQGGVEIEAHGYTDGSCRTATEAIEKALGDVNHREVKNHGQEKRQTIKTGG